MSVCVCELRVNSGRVCVCVCVPECVLAHVCVMSTLTAAVPSTPGPTRWLYLVSGFLLTGSCHLPHSFPLSQIFMETLEMSGPELGSGSPAGAPSAPRP